MCPCVGRPEVAQTARARCIDRAEIVDLCQRGDRSIGQVARDIDRIVPTPRASMCRGNCNLPSGASTVWWPGWPGAAGWRAELNLQITSRRRGAPEGWAPQTLPPVRDNPAVTSSSPNPEAEWWTTTDVAAYLGLRVGTVSSYRQRGQMPAPDMTLGRTHVWQPARIIEWHDRRPRPGVGGRPASSSGAKTTSPDMETGALQAVLILAAAEVGLEVTGVELIRLGSNAVFRVEQRPIIARVAQSPRPLDDAAREVEVARWLEAEGISAVRALALSQPVFVNDRAVTFWESASDYVEYGTTRELAGLLRELHSLDVPFDVPRHDPFLRAANRLRSLGDSESVQYLSGWLEELKPAYAELVFELPGGVIHGDANVGNVIRDRNGQALLADLDNFAIGPREWDLVLTALYFDRYGWHTEQEYADFVDEYGYDLMEWSGYPVLADVRELLMVTWLAERAATDYESAAELKKRLETLRAGGSRRTWRPL